VGGFALAAIPQSVTTQITTCYPKTGATKTLRVIDYQAGQRCTAGENTLSWQANGLHWRGAWSSSTLYAKHDVVASGGSSYVAIAGGVSHAPPNPTYWAVLAAQGPVGPAGAFEFHLEASGTSGIPCAAGVWWTASGGGCGVTPGEYGAMIVDTSRYASGSTIRVDAALIYPAPNETMCVRIWNETSGSVVGSPTCMMADSSVAQLVTSDSVVLPAGVNALHVQVLSERLAGGTVGRSTYVISSPT